MSEQEPEGKVSFNDVFSLRRPRDFRAGLSSGLKSMAKGIVGGAAGLVAAPAIGASTDGVAGFAKGLATGVAGAVVLPVTGVVVGTVQMARGIMNTPEAITEAQKGKMWDQEQRVWVEGGAIQEYQPGGKRRRGKAAAASAVHGPSSGVDYYELLQVARDAPVEEIKKQYYMLARKYHPDKNRDDPQAKERFQQLGEAYQVLSDSDLRARYDAHGLEGLDVNFMDSAEFFNMLFGSECFEHLVGELMIATAAREGMELDGAQMKYIQDQRVDTLAVLLKAMLRRYVEGDEEGFKIAMKLEAQRMVSASFGETMLHACGKVYSMQADIALGGLFDGTLAKMKQSKETIRSQFHAANAALKVMKHQQKMDEFERQRERLLRNGRQAGNAASAEEEGGAGGAGISDRKERHPSGSESGDPLQDNGAEPSDRIPIEELMERAKLEEAGLPLVLEAMWAANVIDIQMTLQRVCRRVLKEPNVPKEVLRLRALGLKTAGEIFINTKAAAEVSLDYGAKEQMEEAMKKVMEKKMAAEAKQHVNS